MINFNINSKFIHVFTDEPIVLHQYDKVAYDIHETARVVCQVRAFPRPDFEWSFNGNKLHTAMGDHYDVNATVLAEDVFRSVLLVSNIRDVDYGEYKCSARNSMGRLHTPIRLQPKGPPERPKALSSVSTTHNTVTLQWEPGFDGGLQDTKYFVSYRKIGAPDQLPGCEMTGHRSDTKEGREFDCQKNNTCNVTSLEPHYTYVFKVNIFDYTSQYH
jgi:echinoid protein